MLHNSARQTKTSLTRDGHLTCCVLEHEALSLGPSGEEHAGLTDGNSNTDGVDLSAEQKPVRQTSRAEQESRAEQRKALRVNSQRADVGHTSLPT